MLVASMRLLTLDEFGMCFCITLLWGDSVMWLSHQWPFAYAPSVGLKSQNLGTLLEAALPVSATARCYIVPYSSRSLLVAEELHSALFHPIQAVLPAHAAAAPLSAGINCCGKPAKSAGATSVPIRGELQTEYMTVAV